jgi:predicted dehydrogenase
MESNAMTTVRWGMLSTANIATTKVIPAMQQGKYCEITAIIEAVFHSAQSGMWA